MNEEEAASVYEFDEETDMYSVERKVIRIKGEDLEYFTFTPASIVTLPDDEVVKKERKKSKTKKKPKK